MIFSKQFLIVLLSNLSLINIHAQNPARLYEEKVLYRYGNVFKIGEEKFKFNQLQYEFKDSEIGSLNYNKAKKYRVVSTIFRSASLAAFFGIINSAYNSNKQQALIFLGVQMGFIIGGRIYLNISNESIDKAIYYRNKDYLFPK